MGYRLTWRCDGFDCPRIEMDQRPDPSRTVGASVPPGWVLKPVSGKSVYAVYCPDHKGSG